MPEYLRHLLFRKRAKEEFHTELERIDLKTISTLDLYVYVNSLIKKADFPYIDDFVTSIGRRMKAALEAERRPTPSPAITHAFGSAVGILIDAEHLTSRAHPLTDADQADILILEARYREYLYSFVPKFSDPRRTVAALTDCFVSQFISLLDQLPEACFSSDPASTEVPILDLIEDVPETIAALMVPLFSEEIRELRLLEDIRRRIAQNMPTDKDGSKILPENYATNANDLVKIYLKDTPYSELFNASVPFSIPDRPYRMEHAFIIGGSGAGKTTLIQQLILDDLAKSDPPAIVVIDPKGELVRRIQSLDVFHPEDGRLRDRLVVVDPDDAPALNMFHAADRWNRTYDDVFRHRLESQAIENFSYIFSTIESPLTQKQSVCFNFCIRLLFNQEANITTLMELLDDPAKKHDQSRFHTVIERIDDITRGFFQKDYFASNFSETRQQIKARLYSILVHPQLLAMFSSRERRLDMFDAIQRKKVVLVNASLGSPGSQASQLFARYFVALTLNAAFERSGMPDRSQWHPSYLTVDEFQLVADEVKTPEMLRLAREYNLGITLAFQEIHGKPFNDSLRAAISTNTSVKYASSPEGVDLAYAARDLRCDPEFVRAQTKTATHAKFACFVRGYLDRPVSISVPFGNIKPDMQMSDEALRTMRERNRRSLTVEPLAEKPTSPATTPESPSPSEPIEAPTASPDSPTAIDPDAGTHTDAASKWGK